MIQRYTREEMGKIWSRQNRFDQMLKVETASALALARFKLIPTASARAIQKKAKFSLKIIDRLEQQTKHDVSAFVKNVSQSVGRPHGWYVHYGLTSSDVLDTALSLQIKESSKIIKKSFIRVKAVLKKLTFKHRADLCAGRTHGMHADSTTFGFKVLGFLSELDRAEKTFHQTIEENAVGMASGPVGNYSLLPPRVELEICRKLGLKQETASTQVVPRDRYARVLFSLCLIGNFLERLAVELRHLQRTEVLEAVEGFEKNQQGSSSMPHKKNPISAENITGTARLLRSYLQAALENTALWHERDISHSSVERVIFPDAFILCDYSLNRMGDLLNSLNVNPEQMKRNMLASGGQVFSSQVLSKLVERGMSRQKAYTLVQKASHDKNGNLIKGLKASAEVKKYLKPSDLENIFLNKTRIKAVSKLVENQLKKF